MYMEIVSHKYTCQFTYTDLLIQQSHPRGNVSYFEKKIELIQLLTNITVHLCMQVQFCCY